jgi:hypothetical protein
LNYDISGILSNWDYDPVKVNARWVKGSDGLMKVQLRLDLGLFQMDVDGRPDGTRPHGYESLLEYYRALSRSSPHNEKPFTLNRDSCVDLQQEAVQYYYRYLSFHALHYFEGVVRDTDHNLGLLELVSRYAEDDDLSWQFLQFYPYIRMMNARTKAEVAMTGKRHEEAVHILQKALDDIHAFLNEYGEDESERPELDLINDMMSHLKDCLPQSGTDRLREQLERAIATEDYEKAAILRDKLNSLTKVAEKKNQPAG